MAKINREVVSRVSDKIKNLVMKGSADLNFYSFNKDEKEVVESDKFPSINAPGVVDFFFAVTMQNYGFWKGDKDGYTEPIISEVNGKTYKGSDLLHALSMKMYNEKGPDFFSPKNLAQLELHEFSEWIPDRCGFQDIVTRYNMAVNYGKVASDRSRNFNLNPESIIMVTNRVRPKIKTFNLLTKSLPGYNRDILYKKNLLLAMILANRPENFLKISSDEAWSPIVDYHLMRVSERLGIIDLSPEEYELVSKRKWVSQDQEAEIRVAVYDAVNLVIELSGKSMSEIDFLLWSARRYCPEMTEPDCPKCVFGEVCEKRVDLFQPIYRTTNY